LKPDFLPEPQATQIDRASIRKANLQALQALKGEISAPVVVSSIAETAVEETQPKEDETTTQNDQKESPLLQLEDDKVIRDNEDAMSIEETNEIPMPPPPTAFIPERDQIDLEFSVVVKSDDQTRGVKRKLDEMEIADAAEDDTVLEEEEEAENATLALKVNPDGTVDQTDTIRLWEPGYKERYYRQKFKADVSDDELRRRIAKHYVEGLMWVLHYYYQGAPSWQWYYPFHFAPFASDFEDIQSFDIKFEKGEPFKPFEQLMGVFPPASRQHIPVPLQHLMVDETSPIIDFYPATFDIDMNGKRMAWQGVALLPFIDQTRLLAAVKPEYSKLDAEERKRNSWGNSELFVSELHPLFATMLSLYGRKRKGQVRFIMLMRLVLIV
jgi:5'-3' exoribonuclease 2